MTVLVGEAGSLKRQYASQAAGFVAVIIAAAALVGWWTGLPLLSSWGPGFPPMRPLGALCLAALGFALVHPGKNSRLAFAVGLAAAALAALGLAQLYQLAPSNSDFYGAPARKRESNQRRPIANRL